MMALRLGGMDMKNYALTAADTSQFITDVREMPKGTLMITFADGKVFKNITACPENFQKIIAQQELQAKKGIANYKVFQNKARRSKIGSILSWIATPAAIVGASTIPSVHQAMLQQPVLASIGAGIVMLFGVVPATYKCVREGKRMKELKMLSYRQEYLEELRSYAQYPNALMGLNPRLANWIRSSQDPFSILDIDSYDQEDLERIMQNIQTEENYQFTYPKRKKGK